MPPRAKKGELVVYVDRITRTDTNEKGEDIEREIPFLKGLVAPPGCRALPTQPSTLRNGSSPVGSPDTRVSYQQNLPIRSVGSLDTQCGVI